MSNQYKWEVRSYGFAGLLRVYHSGTSRSLQMAKLKAKFWAKIADYFQIPSELGVMWQVHKEK